MAVGHQRLQLGWRLLARPPSAALNPSALLSPQLPGGAAAVLRRAQTAASVEGLPHHLHQQLRRLTVSQTASWNYPEGSAAAWSAEPNPKIEAVVGSREARVLNPPPNPPPNPPRRDRAKSSARLTGRGWLVTRPGW